MTSLTLFFAICASATCFAFANNDGNLPASPVGCINSVVFSQSLTAAEQLLSHHEVKAALHQFETLLAQQPTCIPAQLGLIKALFQDGQYREAARAAQRALQSNPGSASLHAALGDICFRLALLDRAQSEYEAARDLDGKSARAWIGLARIYSARSLTYEAQSALAKARDIDPTAFSTWIAALPAVQRNIYQRYLAGETDAYLLPGGCKRIMGAEAESARSKVQIPLVPLLDEFGSVRGLGVMAKLNGHVKTSLLLDTGASGIVIGSKLAKRSGVTRLADRWLPGLGGAGRVDGYLGHIDSMEVGRLELRDCIVEVSSRDEVVREDGLIGPNVFANYLITIDFPARWIVLEPRSESKLPTVSPEAMQRETLMFGHLLMVTAKVDKASGLFLIDSGANSSTVSSEFADQTDELQPATTKATGLSGPFLVMWMSRSATLELADKKLSAQPIVTVDLGPMGKRIGMEITGQIGFSALKHLRIQIDYHRGRLKIDPSIGNAFLDSR